MQMPELIELSPSSLMGGLHGSLATYAALMCKISMYPSYILMCSTGKILVKWKNTQDASDVLVSVVEWALWTGMYLTLGMRLDTTTIM
ncbi:Bis(5'-nucleosyl)-tetraphosphatase, symmetrical [Gossypium arboreum]|uniref:Bis(5'-nucleosyl)-tetraphosphatase, symmetrical n=1 Tax=Gossypium arboreum TaxID=29729 RepID=A0A0B0MCY4_GOSAR|nr:Bis(5'-nucleosyl)-tetraphosphatase, symmetrical [Gossypium arboreum]